MSKLKKLFDIINKKKLFIISLVILVFYVFIMIIFNLVGFLNTNDFILSISTALGWLIALIIAIMHLTKARKDNQAALKYEIKKNIQIDAFKEINKGIYKLSSGLSALSVIFLSLPGDYNLHKNIPLISFEKNKVLKEIRNKNNILSNKYTGFLLAIEAYEISIIDFDHYRKYIQFEIEDFKKAVDNFETYFNELDINKLKEDKKFSEFKNRCNKIFEDGNNIQGFLHDYRVLLMNSILGYGEIFDKSVPERKPKDPKLKTLTELANKEEVKKEEERRIQAAIKKR